MPGTTSPEKLFFKPITERRDGYFVSYQPPSAGLPFAGLSLVFLSPTAQTRIVDLMESELRNWLFRYRMPIMATAFDEADQVIDLEQLQGGSHLVGWRDLASDAVISSWRLGALDEYLKQNSSAPDLRRIYADLPFRTEQDVKVDAEKYAKEMRSKNTALKVLLLIWLVVIPAAVAVIEYFAPSWLSFMILGYALWQAYQTWRKIMGRRKPTKREEEEREKKRKMEHYFYHCERNPTGFQRLMVENLDKDIREQVRSEAARL